jgi:hypothetical protein
MMNKLAIAAAALAVLGSAGAYAQPAPGEDQQRAPDTNVQQPAPDQRNARRPAPDRQNTEQSAPDQRNTQQPAPSREDAAAYLGARVAALHSGLQLTPDQERLWPPFENAYRDFAQMRSESAAAPAASDNDLPARVERRAEALIRRGTALKSLAEAGAPLWRSLDDRQKRRFVALIRQNFQARFAERGDRGFGRGRGFDRGGGSFEGRDFEGRGRDGNIGPRQFRFGGRDGDYGARRDFGPRGFGRDGDDGARRGFDGPGRDGLGRDGDRFGSDGPRGFGRRDFGPRDNGSRDNGSRDVGPRDFGSRDFGPRGLGRDGDGYGFGRRGFGRDDGGRGFRPRDFGGRDGDGDRSGFGPRDYGRSDFDGRGRDGGYRDRFGYFGRRGLPWWHPDIGARRGGPGFRTLDDTSDQDEPTLKSEPGAESERF